jgi:hypothetical protein
MRLSAEFQLILEICPELCSCPCPFGSENIYRTVSERCRHRQQCRKQGELVVSVVPIDNCVERDFNKSIEISEREGKQMDQSTLKFIIEEDQTEQQGA